MPNITAVAIKEDPPKLKRGNGIPVTGITPITVDIFIKI